MEIIVSLIGESLYHLRFFHDNLIEEAVKWFAAFFVFA